MAKRAVARMLVPVMQRSVLQRLNRRLREDGLVVRPARGREIRSSSGEWVVAAMKDNSVVQRDVNLDALARAFGALESWEEMV